MRSYYLQYLKAFEEHMKADSQYPHNKRRLRLTDKPTIWALFHIMTAISWKFLFESLVCLFYPGALWG